MKTAEEILQAEFKKRSSRMTQKGWDEIRNDKEMGWIINVTLEAMKRFASQQVTDEEIEKEKCDHKGKIWLKNIAETYCRKCRSIL